jgi:periplasmic protein TonB
VRNLKRALTTNVALASASALLFCGSVVLAQDPPDKTPEVVYEVGSGVTSPKPIYTPDPEYSESARKKKINGTVTLAMIVTADGKVRDPKITRSLDKGLDKQALAAVSIWRFEPATKDGNPVAVHISADVTFRLY